MFKVFFILFYRLVSLLPMRKPVQGSNSSAAHEFPDAKLRRELPSSAPEQQETSVSGDAGESADAEGMGLDAAVQEGDAEVESGGFDAAEEDDMDGGLHDAVAMSQKWDGKGIFRGERAAAATGRAEELLDRSILRGCIHVLFASSDMLRVDSNTTTELGLLLS